MRWLGIASRSFDMMCERANERTITPDGETLADRQVIQHWAAELDAEIRGARLQTLHAAWMIDRHGTKAARDEISAIKFSVANTMLHAVDTAIQVHGALGVTDDTILSLLVPPRAGRSHLRRRRRGAQDDARPPDPAAATGPARRRFGSTDPATPGPATWTGFASRAGARLGRVGISADPACRQVPVPQWRRGGVHGRRGRAPAPGRSRRVVLGHEPSRERAPRALRHVRAVRRPQTSTRAGGTGEDVRDDGVVAEGGARSRRGDPAGPPRRRSPPQRVPPPHALGARPAPRRRRARC